MKNRTVLDFCVFALDFSKEKSLRLAAKWNLYQKYAILRLSSLKTVILHEILILDKFSNRLQNIYITLFMKIFWYFINIGGAY